MYRIMRATQFFGDALAQGLRGMLSSYSPAYLTSNTRINPALPYSSDRGMNRAL
jgi:hypothetical protein